MHHVVPPVYCVVCKMLCNMRCHYERKLARAVGRCRVCRWQQGVAAEQRCLAEQCGEGPTCSHALRAGDKQARVLGDVEAQFMAGLRRKDGRTVGLGL